MYQSDEAGKKEVESPLRPFYGQFLFPPFSAKPGLLSRQNKAKAAFVYSLRRFEIDISNRRTHTA